MPMKAMVYKTLSTVVDDFFAYVVSWFPKRHVIYAIKTVFASRCLSCIAWLVSGTVVHPANT